MFCFYYIFNYRFYFHFFSSLNRLLCAMKRIQLILLNAITRRANEEFRWKWCQRQRIQKRNKKNKIIKKKDLERPFVFTFCLDFFFIYFLRKIPGCSTLAFVIQDHPVTSLQKSLSIGLFIYFFYLYFVLIFSLS